MLTLTMPPLQVPQTVELPVKVSERAGAEVAAFLHNNKDTILRRVRHTHGCQSSRLCLPVFLVFFFKPLLPLCCCASSPTTISHVMSCCYECNFPCLTTMRHPSCSYRSGPWQQFERHCCGPDYAWTGHTGIPLGPVEQMWLLGEVSRALYLWVKRLSLFQCIELLIVGKWSLSQGIQAGLNITVAPHFL